MAQVHPSASYKTTKTIPAKAGIQIWLMDSFLFYILTEITYLTSGNSMPEAYVYIMASKRNGTLYVGVTKDLIRRVYEHKTNAVEGFTKQYHVHNLVYFEKWGDFVSANERERRMKKWNREWKVRLIERDNPEWLDLYDSLIPG